MFAGGTSVASLRSISLISGALGPGKGVVTGDGGVRYTKRYCGVGLGAGVADGAGIEVGLTGGADGAGGALEAAEGGAGDGAGCCAFAFAFAIVAQAMAVESMAIATPGRTGISRVPRGRGR